MLTLRKILTNGEIVNVREPINLGPNCAVEHFNVDENFVVLGLNIRQFDGEDYNRQFFIQIRSTQNLQVIRTIRASTVDVSQWDFCRGIVQDYSKGLI